jgi:Down syndrome cell adhesion molecule-like protein 1
MDKEYIIKGNAAILKCSVPSFVADFVHVVAWINEDKEEIVPGKDFSGGKERYLLIELFYVPLP